MFISDFITGLLNSIGTHVDPIILIRRIQTGMEIPGLRDSLVKILQDYNLQVYAVVIVSFQTDRQAWANSADPDQTAPRGAV